ncbi:beta-1,4 N-acetylgalactosaminyltransferase 2-like [Gadus macrocephalus]|uniref:beta-1,4 N-acetylgalactosaminyltransferase 2-like n=1 Tax=Gadus macrocephalus TaxID=80720 RepID=UPI0028CB1B95|nr:beta-1,4 N-acetylgalactosaminyltransferase 2-like [Gadus macrocephalus]XP_059928931.1 beta-1,4 N-acetylgalactosaminyltransferase 2-like [Gadus macrocephalus]
MSSFIRSGLLQLLLLGFFVVMAFFGFFQSCTVEHKRSLIRRWSPPTGLFIPPSTCFCINDSYILDNSIPSDQLAEILERRGKEYKKHQARTSSILNTLLFAPSNSPLQYPIQGFSVRPMVPTLIPGLALHTQKRSSYKVLLNVTRGILSLGTPRDEDVVNGSRKNLIILETDSLAEMNKLLAKVTYTSTVYHIHTGDLVHFMCEVHQAVFPIVIRQPTLPVLFDIGTAISDQVTVTTKTFMRYKELKLLIRSLRQYYKDMTLIVADDTHEPEKIIEENVLHYIMPGGQGWFAGRTLAVSQVTTKYFLWVDDDFLFTEKTKIEDLVEVMEATPALDVVGGSVDGNQFYFSINYDEGDGVTGGCLEKKNNRRFHSVPNFPQCHLVSGVVNFFLARTDAVNRVRFDPKLKRVGHPEFFIDGLGQLMVATCGHVSISHQPRMMKPEYKIFRHPTSEEQDSKKRLYHYKNYLKCIRFG